MNNTGGAFKIVPGSAAWEAWLAFYRSSGLQKVEARMLAAIVNAKRARQQWLHPLLLEILTSDRSLDDFEIQEHPNGRTVIAICGVAVHACQFDPAFVVPAEMPPALPSAANVLAQKPKPAPAPQRPERRSVGDGDLDAVADRCEAFFARREAESVEQQKRRKLERTRDRLLDDALAAARENKAPNVEEADTLYLTLVEDPHEAVLLSHVGKGPPMKTRVKAPLRARVIECRDNPVALMAKRGQLGSGEECVWRLAAAAKWQAAYEVANPKGIAMDLSKPVVDASPSCDIESTSRLDALQLLKECAPLLGKIGECLCRYVLGDRYSLTEAAGLLGAATRMEHVVFGHRFRECLDTLAEKFKLIPKPARSARRPPDRFDDLSRFSWNPRLYDAAATAKRKG